MRPKPQRVSLETAPSPDDSAGPGRHSQILKHISPWVSVLACLWVVLVTGSVLIGWALANQQLIQFPTPRHYGTMMPLTAVGLLLCMGALWSLRSEHGVSRARHWAASVLAVVPALLGVLFLWEYAADVTHGIDLLLFPETVTRLVLHRPGRSSVATSISLVILGLALLCLDGTSKRLQRTCEIMVLFVGLLAGERLVGFLFGEGGV